MVVVRQPEKRSVLRALLRGQPVKNALIFCNRKRDIGVLHRSLTRHGFSTAALHGDLEQWQRMETLDRFKNGEVDLLVCSDVAARGLDIPGVSHIFNFDVPTHAEDYVHRIGRTGRAGRTGHSFTLAMPEDGKYIAAIQRLIGNDIPRVKVEEIAGAELVEKSGERRGGRRARGGRKDKTPAPAPAPASSEVKPAGKKPETVEKNRQSEKPERDDRKERGRDRGRRADSVGEVPDYKDTPFGETEYVPAFLKR